MQRLGLLPWMALGVALTAAQVSAVMVAAERGVTWIVAAVVAALGVQVVKAWLSALRLRDLGRDPARAVLTALPPLNFLLLGALLEGTPSDAERARRAAAWSGREPASRLLVAGAAAVGRASAVVVPVCVAYGALVAGIEASVPGAAAGLVQGEPDALVVWFQGVLLLFGATGLYLVVQVLKRRTASRASWLPTLLVLPAGFAALGLYPGFLYILGANAMAAIVYGAVGLLVWVVLGGVVQPLWVHVAADAEAHGGRPAIGRAVAAWQAVAVESLVVHGAAATVIFLGLQALFVPGFLLAVALAFAVPAATLDRAAHPFQVSRRLTTGDSARVLTVLAVGLVATILAQIGAYIAVAGLAGPAGAPEYHEAGTFLPGRVVIAVLWGLVYPGGVRLPVVGVGIGAALGAWIQAVVLAALTIAYVRRRPAA